MSIFAVEEGQHTVDKTNRYSKPQRFRLEIRRRQHDQKFKAIRQEFVDSLKSLNFLQDLKSEKDNLTAKKISWLVQGLQSGKNNANFYQEILDMQLEPYLCQVLQNPQISLFHKTKILLSLVQLTYFTPNLPKELIENNLIDHFRVQLNAFTLSDEIEEEYAFLVSKLVLNLSSFRNQELALYFIEADFLAGLGRIAGKLKNELGGEIRETLLRIYANIFKSEIKEFKFVRDMLSKILADEENSKNEDLLCSTLSCLVQAAKIDNFWPYLLTQTSINGQICSDILTLSDLVLENFNEKSFGLIIDFFIAVYDEEDRKATEEMNSYVKLFADANFFYKGLLQLKPTEEEPKTSTKKIVWKCVKLFSKLDCLYTRIYQNNLQRSQIIESIMKRYIVVNPLSRKPLAQTLTKILTEDKTSIDLLIDNGIIDIVHDLLDSQFSIEDKIEVIDLVEKLIETEEEMRDRAKGENKIVGVFVGRGIVREIQKLQDVGDRGVYRRAEMFMGRLSQIMGGR